MFIPGEWLSQWRASMWIEHHFEMFQSLRLRSMHCVTMLEEDFCCLSAGWLFKTQIYEFGWRTAAFLMRRWHWSQNQRHLRGLQLTLRRIQRHCCLSKNVAVTLEDELEGFSHSSNSWYWPGQFFCIVAWVAHIALVPRSKMPWNHCWTAAFLRMSLIQLGCQVVVTHTFVTLQESGGCVVDFHSSSILDAVSSALTSEIVPLVVVSIFGFQDSMRHHNQIIGPILPKLLCIWLYMYHCIKRLVDT